MVNAESIELKICRHYRTLMKCKLIVWVTARQPINDKFDVWRHDALINKGDLAKMSKVAWVVIWIIFVKKITQRQFVFEKTLKTVAENRSELGDRLGQSNSSETGFKENPAGVLRTDFRRGAKLCYRQGKVYNTAYIVLTSCTVCCIKYIILWHTYHLVDHLDATTTQ